MKKQMLMGRHTPHLPEEIVQEILRRLPVRSLIRFQCVCKHWKNLIKSPSSSFIAENLRHQNPSLLLWNQNSASEPLHLSLMDCEMHNRELQNPPFLGSLSEAWIVGSCNGLVCVGINEDDISDFLLWNPATGEVRQIHRTKSHKLNEWDPTGFGFSATVNDYKIVQAYNDPDKAMISTIEAYSLSTGSWKEVEFGSLEGVKPYGDSFTANGCIFWEGINSEEEEEAANHGYLIVSFDIAKEVFTLIRGPPRLHNSRCGFTLSVHEDKLAMLSHSKIGHFPKYLYSLIDLWVLEEGIGSSTKRWSWTKKYTCPSMFHFPLTIWGNDIVWGSFGNKSGDERENDKEIDCQFFIDVITNEGKRFATPGDYVNIFNHVDSLMPIGNSHKHSL